MDKQINDIVANQVTDTNKKKSSVKQNMMNEKRDVAKREAKALRETKKLSCERYPGMPISIRGKFLPNTSAGKYSAIQFIMNKGIYKQASANCIIAKDAVKEGTALSPSVPAKDVPSFMLADWNKNHFIKATSAAYVEKYVSHNKTLPDDKVEKVINILAKKYLNGITNGSTNAGLCSYTITDNKGQMPDRATRREKLQDMVYLIASARLAQGDDPNIRFRNGEVPDKPENMLAKHMLYGKMLIEFQLAPDIRNSMEREPAKKREEVAKMIERSPKEFERAINRAAGMYAKMEETLFKGVLREDKGTKTKDNQNEVTR